MKFMVLPCDGIGPEITSATMAVLERASSLFDLDLSFEFEDAGLSLLAQRGTSMAPDLLARARTYDGVLLGPMSNIDYPPREQGGINISAAFRVGLDLYANVRPARSRPFLPAVAGDMDLVIMREATEGFYADRNMHQGSGEFMPTPEIAMSMRKITAHACERIARQAFKLAMQRDKHVTAVHKANCFKLTDGLFLEQVNKVASEFPAVRVDDVLVDAMTAHLVRDASRFDVIVATNFYADILSDLASELSGSLGLAGSINANAETGLVCAQAQHGSAPDIAGRNVANPASLILSAAMMLLWLGEQRGLPAFEQAGAKIERAVDEVMAQPSQRTRDLGGNMPTDAFAHSVAAALG